MNDVAESLVPRHQSRTFQGVQIALDERHVLVVAATRDNPTLDDLGHLVEDVHRFFDENIFDRVVHIIFGVVIGQHGLREGGQHGAMTRSTAGRLGRSGRNRRG